MQRVNTQAGRKDMGDSMANARYINGWCRSARVSRGSQRKILIAVGRRSDRAGRGRRVVTVQGDGA